MKNLDIEISEKVAQEAGKQMYQLKKEIEQDKNAHISLLEDILSDAKEQRKFLKSILISIIGILFIVTIGSFVLSLHNQKILKDSAIENTEKIFDFISNTNFTSSVEMTTDNNSNAENITINN